MKDLVGLKEDYGLKRHAKLLDYLSPSQSEREESQEKSQKSQLLDHLPPEGEGPQESLLSKIAGSFKKVRDGIKRVYQVSGQIMHGDKLGSYEPSHAAEYISVSCMFGLAGYSILNSIGVTETTPPSQLMASLIGLSSLIYFTEKVKGWRFKRSIGMYDDIENNKD